MDDWRTIKYRLSLLTFKAPPPRAKSIDNVNI